MKKYKGFFHIHSRYSYDGKMALPKIVNLAKSYKFDFMIVTEHYEYLDKKQLKIIEEKCNYLSSPDFVVIPGIEICCESKIHLLSIGKIIVYESTLLIQNIKKTREYGNLAIIAHPPDDFLKRFPETNQWLNGLEVWNNKQDSRWSPELGRLRLLSNSRKFNKQCFGYAGLDLHSRVQFGAPWIEINLKKLGRDEILISLRKGSFKISNGFLTLDSDGKDYHTKFYLIYSMNLLKLVSLRLSRYVPDSIKNYLKKLMGKI